MYADGDPIGELPLRVGAERAAIAMLVPAVSASGQPSAFSTQAASD
jgi:hypothetical protein